MKLTTVAGIGVLVSAMMLMPVGPALAQPDSREAIELQHQILELKRDLQQLRDQGPRAGGSPSGGSFLGGRPPPAESSGSSEITGQLLSRVESLEEQMRRLRGRIDETANQVQRQGDELGKQIGDLGFRIQGLEGGTSRAPQPTAVTPLAPPPITPPPAVLPTQPNVARRTPETSIQEGNAALARRDYGSAEAAAREVLNNSKTSPRTYDAQLLLAQALYGRREWSQAAIAYDDGYKRNRKGARAPEALLGLANALISINEKRAGCDTLNQLTNEFPGPRPELRDGVATARARAGCR